MTYKLNISKAGKNVITETDYNNLIFSSDKGTLKYNTSGTINQSFTSDALIELNTSVVTHNLGYIPYIETYVLGYDSIYQPIPLYTTGASTSQEYRVHVNTTQIIFITRFEGYSIPTSFDIDFYYFIFKNNTGL